MKRLSKTKRSLAALLPALLISACTLGPDYKGPEVMPPGGFRYQIAASEAESFADLPWWSVFEDNALQALIRQGLANNQDLHVAVARIGEARARVAQIESQGKPQIGYSAEAAGQNAFVPEVNGNGRSVTYGNFEGLLSAAWEMDLWGRIRRETEAAQAHLLEQEYVRRGLVLTLVSDLATGYFRLVELDRELVIAEQASKDYKQILELFTNRFNAGKDSRLPVERAQAAYDSSNAEIHDLTRRIGLQEDAIAILLGGYPAPVQRGRELTQQTMPRTPLGATTALLKRRPDIQASEQGMIAANADIGQAVANFYPRIGLSAFLGGQGVSLSSFTGFGVWNVAAALAGPIYSGGRLDAEYRERQAYWDESVAAYKQKVLIAFQETSDALVAQDKLVQQRASLESQVKALQRAVVTATERYQAGRAAYFEVLEAQQQLFPAQADLAQVQRDQLFAVVNLYKALGGGWSDGSGGPLAANQTIARPQNVALTETDNAK